MKKTPHISYTTIILCLFIATLGYAQGAVFWEPYTPDRDTLMLLHFDDGFKDASRHGNQVEPIGAVRLGEGRFGNAAHFNGGALAIDFNTLFPPGEGTPHTHGFVLEMWLNPDELPEPGTSAVIFDRATIPEQGQEWWMQLLLMPDGALVLKAKNDSGWGGPPDSFFRSEAGAVSPGQWQHVAIFVGTYFVRSETTVERLFVNGTAYPAEAYAANIIGPGRRGPAIQGTAYIGAKQPGDMNVEDRRNWPENNEVVFDSETFVPYQGGIDELRISAGLRDYYPEPDNAFCDPEKNRALPVGGDRFPYDNDILLYASFDESVAPDIARGASNHRGMSDIRLMPGVRGNALYLDPAETGRLHFLTEGNIDKQQGTLMMWVQPHASMTRPGIIFDARPAFFGSRSIVGTTYGHVRDMLWPMTQAFSMRQWRHLAWTWDGKVATLYIDGEKAVAVPILESFRARDLPEWMRLYGFQAAYDELKIIDRPLTPAEVGNEYSRYLPDGIGEKNEITKIPEIGLHYVDFRGVNKLVGSAFPTRDIIEEPGTLTLSVEREGRILATTQIPYESEKSVAFAWALPDEIDTGEYSITARMQGRNGLKVEGVQPLHRPDFPWLGNTLGEDDKVLRPWTPMRTDNRSIDVVGRTFKLSYGGLFDKIDCWDEDILAGPMMIEAVDSNDTPHILEGIGATITESKDNRVRWRGRYQAEVDDVLLVVEIAAKMDYDGTTRFELTYRNENPDPVMLVDRGPISLKRFLLRIPLKNEYVELFTTNIGIRGGLDAEMVNLTKQWLQTTAEGEIFSSKRLYETLLPDNIDPSSQTRLPTVGNFIPQLWVGNNECGVSIFGDNDRGWVPENDQPAIQIVRQGETSEIRMNFIASDFVLNQSRTVVFGFLPTPVRPLPDDWRTGDFTPDFGTPFGSGTVHLASYEDERQDLPRLKAVVEARKEKGLLSAPHINAVLFDAGEKTKSQFAAEWHRMYGTPFDWVSESKVDYIIWTIDRWRHDLGIDGVYFDCVHRLPNLNVYSGTAYELDDGRIQHGWTIWNTREYFKRTAHLFGDLYEDGFVWGNVFAGPEIAAWQIATVSGESCFVYTLDNQELVGGPQPSSRPEPVKYYSDFMVGKFNNLRLSAVSHQWGIPQIRIGPQMQFAMKSGWENDPPPLVDKVKTFARSALAETLLLDVRHKGIKMGDRWLPDFFREFREKDGLEFYGFWNNADKFQASPDDILVSAYTADDHLLLIASNLTGAKREARVTIDWKELELATASSKDIVVEDAENDAAWGETPVEVYRVNLWNGPPLLSENDRRFETITTDGKTTITFIIDRMDFRAFHIKQNAERVPE